MNAMRQLKQITLVVLTASLCIAGVSAWAADATPTKAAAPSKEMREKMAAAHEKMAACLRSDHSVADCRHEMIESCKEMGGGACGKMGERHKMMMHGDGEHMGMGSSSAPAPKP